MALIFKAAAAAIAVSLLGLTIKKVNPELSGLMSICTIVCVMSVTLSFAAELKELIDNAKKLINLSDIYIFSIFKCLAVSVITKFSADLCKDSGQTALSSTVEFAGCVCAAMVVMPLIVNMINLVGTMV